MFKDYEYMLAYIRQWKRDNPDRVQQHRRTYRRKHAKTLAGYLRRWRAGNPEKVARYREKRKESR